MVVGATGDSPHTIKDKSDEAGMDTVIQKGSETFATDLMAILHQFKNN